MRYIAFLRAINVGGHTVKMDVLRRLFEELGFSNVETFIASGNVIFEAGEQDARRLEEQIQRHLHGALGYEVAAFLRTPSELAQVAGYRPFPPELLELEGSSLYVAFLQAGPAPALQPKLQALRTSEDEFHLHGRELYWSIRTRLSGSSISGALLERTIGAPITLRNITTVRKLAAKYPDQA